MTKRTTEESNLDPTAHAGGTTTDGTLTLDAIRSLAQVMKDFELAELELSQPSGERLRLVGRRAEVIAAAPIATKTAPSVVVAAPEPHHAPAAPPATGKAPAVDKSITVITAPLVGTFYRSASPESPAFVEIGQRVKKARRSASSKR